MKKEKSTLDILIDHTDEIRNSPMRRNIRFKVASWEECFRKDKIFSNLVRELRHNNEKGEGFKEINRRDIFLMVGEIRKLPKGSTAYNRQLRKFFFAVMLWGYGTIGYGASRAEKIISHKNLPKSIRKSYEYVRDKKIKESYELLSKIPGLGAVFISKYLYFIGKDCSTKPLALDRWVATNLVNMCCANKDKYGLRKEKEKHAPHTDSSGSGYIKYIKYTKDMKDWAEELKVKPDQIECFLCHYKYDRRGQKFYLITPCL